MHTEAEAKQKWCPESRLAVVASNKSVAVVNSTTNVLTEKIDHVACIASACMHWRWADPAFDTRGGYRDPVPAHNDPTARGFCGLSGRP